MATPAQLAARGDLIDLSTALDDHVLPDRCLYAFPKFQDWYENALPGLRPDIRGGGRMDPSDQMDDLLERFLTGSPFDVEWKSRALTPKSEGVWELKTSDIRVFGWFWKPDFFIIYRAMDASWVKDNSAYGGFIRETAYHRDQLDLDKPKFTPGSYSDVFQV